MCGIVGVLQREPDPSGPVSRIGAMSATLEHRGPDGRASYLSPSGLCALGHARLKVIDLETGDQPMGNEDGSVQVVFNGEIYNFQSLRSALEDRGHVFRTRSDTEVLVHGYEEWGEELPRRLEGMFAFAVWDESERSLFVARDRAGQKPLFVYEDDAVTIFASEVKAILAARGVDDSLDPKAFPLYLAYGYVPTPGTFHRRIRKVRPGSWERWSGPGSPAGTGAYWRPDFTPRAISFGAARAELRTRLREAVRRRLVADVPLGAFLSGGVDSSIIVGLMSEMVDEPVRTFSIGFADDPNYDETSFAEMVSERFGTQHTRFVVEAGAVGLVDDLVHVYDEPFGDSSAIPTSIVSRLTREHVTVALSGDAGDELFGGYLRFRAMQVAERLPRPLVRAAHVMARLWPHNSDFRSLPRRAERFLSAAALPSEERMLHWIGFFASRLDSMLRPEALELVDRDELTSSFTEPWTREAGLPPIARTLALNFETYLLDDLLVKADRCSMAHSLELRAPFLDSDLMAFAMSLPDGLRIRGRSFKHILKESFRDLLPHEIRGRPKWGFAVPLPMWFRTHWRPLVEERLLDPEARLWEWLRREPLVRMAEDHFDGRADNGHQLWALLTLETWLQKRWAVTKV